MTGENQMTTGEQNSVIAPPNNARILVRGAYDIQALRIQTGNRIFGNFKVKLGQLPGTAEEALDPQSKEILTKIRSATGTLATNVVANVLDPKKDSKKSELGDAYPTEPDSEDSEAEKKEKKLAGLVSQLIDIHYAQIMGDSDKIPQRRRFMGTPIISDFTELCLISEYKELYRQEKTHFGHIEKILDDYDIYREFLQDVRGVGPAMAGVIISEVNIEKAKYATSLFRYAGLDVAEDGRGRSRRAEHLVDVQYTARDGSMQTRKSITFNPWLKTKLIGVLATSFLRSKSPYADIYYNYKHRLENHPNWVEESKRHRHNAAIRYMIKQFLAELYEQWRPLRGLPAYKPYEEEKLGLTHGRDPKINLNQGRAAA